MFVLSSFGSTGDIPRFGGEITKPTVVITYSNIIGGIDECDQFMSCYTLCRKSTKL